MRNGPYELVVAPDDYPGMKYRGRYCYEHTLVYWKKHGVLPGRGQVIHHINGKHRDNRPENLELLEVGEHNSGHNTVERIDVPCAYCGKTRKMRPCDETETRKRNKTGEVFCSRSCGMKYWWQVA